MSLSDADLSSATRPSSPTRPSVVRSIRRTTPTGPDGMKQHNWPQMSQPLAARLRCSLSNAIPELGNKARQPNKHSVPPSTDLTTAASPNGMKQLNWPQMSQPLAARLRCSLSDADLHWVTGQFSPTDPVSRPQLTRWRGCHETPPLLLNVSVSLPGTGMEPKQCPT